MNEGAIKEIADAVGIEMYGPIKIVGDGNSIRLVRSEELTVFGEKLILFANAVEKYILSSRGEGFCVVCGERCDYC